MPLQIIHRDITRMAVDAVAEPVEAPEFRVELVPGTELSSRYMIRMEMPSIAGEALMPACRMALELALENHLESLAIPLTDSGMIDAVGDFLAENDLDVFLTVRDKAAFRMDQPLYDDLRSYLFPKQRKHVSGMMDAGLMMEKCCSAPDFAVSSLAEFLARKDESFREMLFRKIDEAGKTDAEVYHRANISRKLFSKIRCDNEYHPSKSTVVALGVALELDREEFDDFLAKAGYAFTYSSIADKIIIYFIENGDYDTWRINEALFTFDQSLLGDLKYVDNPVRIS